MLMHFDGVIIENKKQRILEQGHVGIIGYWGTKKLFIIRLDILESALCRKLWNGVRWAWLHTGVMRFCLQRQIRNGLLLWCKDTLVGLKSAFCRKLWHRARWAWLYTSMTRFCFQKRRRNSLIFWYGNTWINKY